MKDIYEIKNILLGLPIWIEKTLILLIFFIWSYFLLKKYFWEEEKELEKNNIEEKIFYEDKNFSKFLDEFEKNFFNAEKNIFYQKISEILKGILENKFQENFSNLTFDELRKMNLDWEIENLLKNIYFKEYAKKIEDWEDLRKKIIFEVRKILEK